jgi:hypothetical protein
MTTRPTGLFVPGPDAAGHANPGTDRMRTTMNWTTKGVAALATAPRCSAPDTWIVQTGETLVSDWRNGQTTAQTDQILLAGGILPGHLAAFDSVTQQDLGA